MERKLTFEEQQDLNRTRDTAMRVACEGLTTLELQRLNPSLLEAVPGMCEALRYMLTNENVLKRIGYRYEVDKMKKALAKVFPTGK